MGRPRALFPPGEAPSVPKSSTNRSRYRPEESRRLPAKCEWPQLLPDEEGSLRRLYGLFVFRDLACLGDAPKTTRTDMVAEINDAAWRRAELTTAILAANLNHPCLQD
jgi:hypothetical protein